MTRGSKIVISAIFGLLLLAGVYFAFFAPNPARQQIDGVTEPSPLAGTDSLTLGPSPDAGVQGGLAAPSSTTTVPGSAMTSPSFPAGSAPSGSGFDQLTTLPVIAAPAAPTILPVNPPTPPAPTTLTETKPQATTPPPPLNSPDPALFKPTKPKAATAKSSDYTSYTVKSGDTLSSIAGEWFRDVTRWKDIVAANPGLSPQSLRVGQKINLPSKAGSAAERLAGGGSSSKSAPKSATSSASQASAGTTIDGSQHVVAAGETLASIATKAYGSGSSANWKRIYEANKSVIGANPSALKVGMKLVIPARQG
jgi:nucleoid-associated protein YgaU